jgi:hypothetical protein
MPRLAEQKCLANANTLLSAAPTPCCTVDRVTDMSCFYTHSRHKLLPVLVDQTYCYAQRNSEPTSHRVASKHSKCLATTRQNATFVFSDKDRATPRCRQAPNTHVMALTASDQHVSRVLFGPTAIVNSPWEKSHRENAVGSGRCPFLLFLLLFL